MVDPSSSEVAVTRKDLRVVGARRREDDEGHRSSYVRLRRHLGRGRDGRVRIRSPRRPPGRREPENPDPDQADHPPLRRSKSGSGSRGPRLLKVETRPFDFRGRPYRGRSAGRTLSPGDGAGLTRPPLAERGLPSRLPGPLPGGQPRVAGKSGSIFLNLDGDRRALPCGGRVIRSVRRTGGVGPWARE